ncbi:hypothetical protein SLS58_006637 [Diplodia intermedia]|uniref:Uncharacterized protein n=1 Tax=Diplodia intermedia TaxID=856260 RepID=A0ABR3TNC7_9PEZI
MPTAGDERNEPTLQANAFYLEHLTPQRFPETFQHLFVENGQSSILTFGADTGFIKNVFMVLRKAPPGQHRPLW